MLASNFFSLQFLDLQDDLTRTLNCIMNELKCTDSVNVLVSSNLNRLERVIFVKYSKEINVQKIFELFPDAVISYGENAIEKYLEFFDDFINDKI